MCDLMSQLRPKRDAIASDGDAKKQQGQFFSNGMRIASDTAQDTP